MTASDPPNLIVATVNRILEGLHLGGAHIGSLRYWHYAISSLVLPESGVKTIISGLKWLQSVDLFENVTGQVS